VPQVVLRRFGQTLFVYGERLPDETGSARARLAVADEARAAAGAPGAGSPRPSRGAAP
jgi:hypothetical protein